MLMRALPSPLLEPPPWRGCQLCHHGMGPDDQRLCGHPDAVGNQPQPVELLRRSHGACGPEAVYLDFPGLHA